MTNVVFLMSMGNWSVSHPRSGEPVFASTEPNMPNLPREENFEGCGDANVDGDGDCEGGSRGGHDNVVLVGVSRQGGVVGLDV